MAALHTLLGRDDPNHKDAGQELIDLLKNPFVADKVKIPHGHSTSVKDSVG